MLASVTNPENESRRIKYRVKLTDLVDSKPLYVWTSDKTEVMIVREGKNFRAISSVCPHMGAQMQWDPRSGAVHCPWHGLRYDRALKSCHHRYRTLTEYQVEVSGNDLVIYA